MTDEPISNGWHLDKRAPLALIITVLIQSGTAVWWAANVSNRLTALEVVNRDTSDQAGRIIRTETRIDILTGTLTRIEDKLDRALRDQLPTR